MVVRISFKGNLAKLYDYFTDLNVKVGEPVVVPTGSTFSIGKVEKILQGSNKATAWVVQRVDVEGHKRRMEERELDALLNEV